MDWHCRGSLLYTPSFLYGSWKQLISAIRQLVQHREPLLVLCLDKHPSKLTDFPNTLTISDLTRRISLTPPQSVTSTSSRPCFLATVRMAHRLRVAL